MATRYRLRHSSLRQELGPYTKEQLSASIAAGAFPADSEVRPEDEGGGDWEAVTAVLGLAPPPRATPTAQAAVAAAVPNENRQMLDKVRAATAYEGFRLMISILAVAGIAITLITTLIALDASRGSGATGPAMTLAGAALEIVVILVAAAALRALADIADCALRK